MPATSVPEQLCFEGMSRPDEWQPVAATLARLKDYLSGFARNGREIFARRQYIADRCGIKVRTLARYLRYLKETGWLATVKRKARHCIRKVLKVFSAGPSFGPSRFALLFSDGYTPECPPEKAKKPRGGRIDWDALLAEAARD
jgi:hypothetical protein